MSNFETPTVRLTAALGAIAAAVAVGVLATPASAASIFLDKGELFNPGTAYITGPSGSNYSREYVYAGPVLFTANHGVTGSTHNTFQFLGFCVDIFDDITVGVNSPGTVNLPYHEGALVDNGAHSPYPVSDRVILSQIQKDDISALVNFGTGLWNTDALTDPNHHLNNTLIDELAGVQGAIWKIENPTFTITGAPPVNGWGDTAGVTSDINHFSSQAFLSTLPVGRIDTVFSTGTARRQTFAFSATPEPATWVSMIVGFGAMGAVLRRRRPATAAA